MTESSRLALSSSLFIIEIPRLSGPVSGTEPISRAPRAAEADGLSKLTGPVEERPIVAEVMVAGDFLTCCGDDRGPRGEKAA